MHWLGEGGDEASKGSKPVMDFRLDKALGSNFNKKLTCRREAAR